MFTDSHCHIYQKYYGDILNIVKEAKLNNVDRFINCGCSHNENKEVINLINLYPNMYGAIGIHPSEVETYHRDDITYLLNNLDNPKVIAIGEIGLDYYYTKDNKEEQIKLFKMQLKIAEENNIPVIIHSRDATLDTINTLKEYNVQGIIHSFSGSIETAKEYIKMGFLLGVNGVITFKNANIKEVIKNIPLEYIVLETDSPYLTPEPFRGKQNNPSYIYNIAKFVADLKGISILELASITNKNLENLFPVLKTK